jgi:hypothetical protein
MGYWDVARDAGFLPQMFLTNLFKFLGVNPVSKSFHAIYQDDRDIVPVLIKQLLASFDVDLSKIISVPAAGLFNCSLRFVTQMATGSSVKNHLNLTHSSPSLYCD